MTPTLIPSSASSATIAQVAAMLGQGQLVALPTETVYGLAFNLRSAEARDRAKALKDIAPGTNPNWVLHVPNVDDALALLPDLSAVGQRLMRRVWPGPVALQIRLSPADETRINRALGEASAETLLTEGPDHYLTLRCPDVPITQDILAATHGLPIAIVGAASTGQPPAYDASDIPPAVAERLEAIIDAGPTRYRKPSTLVRIVGDRVSVIRPGVIDERIIQRLTDFILLFICSGNTCRSPMAAGLAAKLLSEKLGTTPERLAEKRLTVLSAGLHASRGMHATYEAVEAAADRGSDIASHFSQPATIELLRRADLIYTMTQAHREEIIDALPGAEKKTFRLDPGADIDDPIGMDETVYRQVAEHLEDAIRLRLSEINL